MVCDKYDFVTYRFRALAGFKVIQQGRRAMSRYEGAPVSVPSRGSRLSNVHPIFPSRPGVLVSVPSRGSRLSNTSLASSLSTPLCFRPLAGFKVIQRSYRGELYSAYVESKFPSPRGVQGYPTGRGRRGQDACVRVSVPSRGSRLSN